MVACCHMVPTKFPIIIASVSFGSPNFDGFCREDADRGEHALAYGGVLVSCCIVLSKFKSILMFILNLNLNLDLDKGGHARAWAGIRGCAG